MSTPSTQLAHFGGMGIYELFHPIGSWGETFRSNGSPTTDSSTVQVDLLDNKTDYIAIEPMEPSRSDQESNKPTDKIQRRLAQNREAARKSRLRKKAYVQQLETSHLKLAQLERELGRAKQQGLLIGSASDSLQAGFSGTVNSGIAAFEMEYRKWIEEQHQQTSELRNGLQTHTTDIELQKLVESSLNHYNGLFHLKADAAKADVFYLISGKWKTSAECFFLWIGGFRPSALLNVLMPQLDPLTDQQSVSIFTLKQSSQQAEDALSQGIDKLKQTLAQTIATDLVSVGGYGTQIVAAMENLEALEGFVNQADHLRQQTLQQMSRILPTRQAARGLVALGEYFHRLRSLSHLAVAARPCESE